MDGRLDLHEILCKLVGITDPVDGDRHVYYQPPESRKMKYPAIRYSRNNIVNRHANNDVYLQSHSYEVIVIDYDPDSKITEALSQLKFCRFDRHYVSNNLNHDVFTLYY